MLAHDLACALDPALFAERAGITPDDWQAELLRSPAKQMILNCSRQSGKSTVTSILAAHQAVYAPDSLTLIFSPSLRQSGELFLKTKGVLTAVGAIDAAPTDTTTTITLANGSRIVSLPGSDKTVRGYSAPDLVIEDEAARVSDDLYTALRPMLAVSNGRFVLLSTPFGRRGHFYGAWTEGDEDWQRVLVTALQCSRISPEWLARERAAMPAWAFRQEYLCEFVQTDDAYFPTEHVERAFTDGIAPLFAEGELTSVAD